MDEAKQLREKVQKRVVEIISTYLEKGDITEERAKQIAQFILQALPEDVSYERLMEIIPTLDDEFSELTVAVVPIMQEYEAKIKAMANQKISNLIKEGKLDEALDVTRQAIEIEKKLS